jgi:hypothetical protein
LVAVVPLVAVAVEEVAAQVLVSAARTTCLYIATSMGLISLRNSRFPGPTYDGLDFGTPRHHIDRYSSLGKTRSTVSFRNTD